VDRECKAERYQLYGWILFIACALLFIVESFINRQPLLFVGSIIFLLACVLFLVPLIETLRNGKDRGKNYTRGKP
jgi:membrane-bound ClpP family serine protease